MASKFSSTTTSRALQTASQTLVLLLSLLFYPFVVLFTSLVLPLLPPRTVRRLNVSKDLFLSLLVIAFGRLLPDLPPLASSAGSRRLEGKTAIVTGGNSGIGLQLAIDLAQLGAKVVIACRSMGRAEEALTKIRQSPLVSNSQVSAMQLDTSDMASVRAFADAWRQWQNITVDILCHNAGIATVSSTTNTTADGIEMVYATNLLGSFLLTHLLEAYLSPSARVIFTSSTGQYSGRISKNFVPGPVRGVLEPGFHCPVAVGLGGWQRVSSDSAARYGNSKLMQCVLARCLQRRWDAQKATVVGNVKTENGSVRPRRVAHAFTPGFTMTPIFGKVTLTSVWTDFSFAALRATTALAVDVEQGTRTGSWLASADDVQIVAQSNGGAFWERMRRRMGPADLMSDEMLDRLWERWSRDTGVQWSS